MSPDAPPFARYVALVLALRSAPAPTPPPARVAAPRKPRSVWKDEHKSRYYHIRDNGVSIAKAAERLNVPLGTAKFWEEQRKGNR